MHVQYIPYSVRLTDHYRFTHSLLSFIIHKTSPLYLFPEKKFTQSKAMERTKESLLHIILDGILIVTTEIAIGYYFYRTFSFWSYMPVTHTCVCLFNCFIHICQSYAKVTHFSFFQPKTFALIWLIFRTIYLEFDPTVKNHFRLVRLAGVINLMYINDVLAGISFFMFCIY